MLKICLQIRLTAIGIGYRPILKMNESFPLLAIVEIEGGHPGPRNLKIIIIVEKSTIVKYLYCVTKPGDHYHDITKSKFSVKKGSNYIANLVLRNALKLTYGDVEMQKFSGGETPGPPLHRAASNAAREGASNAGPRLTRRGGGV